ncbi:MAG: adenine phosphoribosyltransferase [Gammaproteobacteria bacterium]|nr:adenine phosphoribosyltransferase [Gammaproteobacteria bacterium]
MNDPLKLKQYIRTVDDFPIDGIKFRDITSLIETPEAFVETCDELTKMSKSFNATSVASIESRGFIFAGSIAKDLSLPFILARKPGKLPNKTFVKEFELEYGRTSIEIQKNTMVSESDRVVVVDDLVATGGTAIACAELLTENFNVKKENILILAVIDLPDLGGSRLIADQGYGIETLVRYTS